MSTIGRAVVAVTLIALLAACGGTDNANRSAGSTTGSATGGTTPRGGPRQLVDLHDLGQLRSLFNARAGEPRLILLVSPT
jgi:hypothetical protein